MQELTVLAAVEKLEEVQEFLGQALTEYQCDDMLRMQFEIAVEEIFVNVAYYAYPPDEGGYRNDPLRAPYRSGSDQRHLRG